MQVIIDIINFTGSLLSTLVWLAMFAFIIIIIAKPEAFYSLFPKITNRRLQKQVKELGLGFNENQWQKNIEKSDFLKNLFGNWSTVHGRILTKHLKRNLIKNTGKYKDYEIEIFEFLIRTRGVKTNKYPGTTDMDVGPFVGLHFNLNNKYPEVDIIYRETRGFKKLIVGNTIKARSWNTESQKFNDFFTILSQDQITNLIVLTPDIMARMLDSKLKINIEINDNHLLIYAATSLKKGNELKTMLNIGYRIAENLE